MYPIRKTSSGAVRHLPLITLRVFRCALAPFRCASGVPLRFREGFRAFYKRVITWN
jgi:hypothetical protein